MPPAPLPNPPLPSQPFDADALPTLIDASRPAQVPVRPLGTMMTAAWVAALIAMSVGVTPAVMTGVFSIAVIISIGFLTFAWSLNQARLVEGRELVAIEDLIAMKRYEQAAPRLHWLLLRPMRSHDTRLRALLLLATLLARMQRHEESLVIYNELIDTERVAGPGGAMVKLGRAMALLHADHLYDADRAINDLRRLIDRGGAGAELEQARVEGLGPTPAADDNEADGDKSDSLDEPTSEPEANVIVPSVGDTLAVAGLRLLELYRDVKTGHTAEAIELFQTHRGTMRRGLGHRVAEAHALAAVAYDRANRPADAARAFADATALQPMADLLNRYAECRPLIAKYAVTSAPAL